MANPDSSSMSVSELEPLAPVFFLFCYFQWGPRIFIPIRSIFFLIACFLNTITSHSTAWSSRQYGICVVLVREWDFLPCSQEILPTITDTFFWINLFLNFWWKAKIKLHWITEFYQGREVMGIVDRTFVHDSESGF